MKQWIQVRILTDTKNQKKDKRFWDNDGGDDTITLFLLFFSIFLIFWINPELTGWENGRPTDTPSKPGDKISPYKSFHVNEQKNTT